MFYICAKSRFYGESLGECVDKENEIHQNEEFEYQENLSPEFHQEYKTKHARFTYFMKSWFDVFNYNFKYNSSVAY